MIRCPRCGQEYPSDYYFRTPLLCSRCYEKLGREEKLAVDREAAARAERQTPDDRTRRFWVLLLLSILTLGIYYFLWLYLNLREIRSAFPLSGGERTVAIARVLLVVKILFVLGTMIISLALVAGTVGAGTPPERMEIPPGLLLLTLLDFLLSVVFYYYFTASISLTQQKAGLEAVSVGRIYPFMIVYLTIDFATGAYVILSGHAPSALRPLAFLAVLGSVGLVALVVYLYNCQLEINRIWREGAWRVQENTT